MRRTGFYPMDSGLTASEQARLRDFGMTLMNSNENEVLYYHESSMRHATDMEINAPIKRNKEEPLKNRRRRIISRRMAFEWLPVYFSNDLVHGSWWFVVGSIIAMLIPVVPLLDLFYGFWDQSATLPILQDAATFVLLIVSGFFFTLGSLAFVRATEDPPLKPLFSGWTHFETDELLAAWLFLLGTVPFPAFMSLYVYYYPKVYVYWGCLFASLIFVIATYMFVLACYPSNEPRDQFIPYLLKDVVSEDCWMHKHISNDWLAGTWIFFYGTLFMCLGSFSMLITAILDKNNLDIFDWASSFLDSIIFLIGSAYFCAGSYPQEARKTYHVVNGERKLNEEAPLVMHSSVHKSQ